MVSSKQAEFQARKDQILAITIEHYIKTVSPVSSAFIATGTPLDLSSATIRNIFVELEEEGYLTHPHTSAGRIPTERGYRYYVDYLMDEIQLLEGEKARIKAEYERQTKKLEVLLERTSRILSHTTSYTSIISVDGWDNKIFCQGTSFIAAQPDYQDLTQIRDILAALDEKEKLLEFINRSLAKKVQIFIGHEMAYKNMKSCSLAISTYQTKEGLSGRIALLGPTRMDYERVVSALEYFSKLMGEIL